MAADKQNDAKVSLMEENKENLPDGGLGLESILKNTTRALWRFRSASIFHALKLTLAFS